VPRSGSDARRSRSPHAPPPTPAASEARKRRSYHCRRCAST
jgi:hypothetical protein